MSFSVEKFHKLILCWYRTHGRRGLPWRKTHNPYEILVSEIMLQQTQVERVISKYRNFLKKFPTAKKLARAGTFEVLKEWKGLGYNRRALYLKKAAEKIVNDFGIKISDEEITQHALSLLYKETGKRVEVKDIPKDIYALAFSRLVLIKAEDYVLDQSIKT